MAMDTIKASFILSDVNIEAAQVHNKEKRVWKKITDGNPEDLIVCASCGVSFHGKKFSLNCSIDELKELGIAFPLLYNFIKSLILIQLLAGLCVGIPCAINNWKTNHIPFVAKNMGSWYQSSFIQPGINLPIWQTLLHSSFCIFMIFYMFIIKRYLASKKKHNTASDFTIWAKNLPSNYNAEELKWFYENKKGGYETEVIYISPIYDISYFMNQKSKLIKAKKLQSEINKYKKEHHKNPQASCCNSKEYNEELLEKKIEKLKEYFKKVDEQNDVMFRNSKSAFVTFRSLNKAKGVRKFWKRSLIEYILIFFFYGVFGYFDCFYRSKKFHRKILSVSKPPEPSDLTWENLSVTRCSKYSRRMFTLVFTLLFLALLFLVVFELKSYQYAIKGKSKVSENESEDEVMRAKSISILMSLLIIIVGRIIAIIVRQLSNFEKHVSKTGYHNSVVNKLIFSTTLNSIAVLLIVNIVTASMLPFDIPGFDTKEDSIYQQYGLASDLFWLLVTDSIVSPLTSIFSLKYIYLLYRRHKIRKSEDYRSQITSQKELNEIWENPDADMAQIYANYMKTLLIVFVFAPIFPLVFFIGFLSMIIQYWTDKILLLRLHSRPPEYDNGLSNNILKWMPIVIVAYSVIFNQISNLTTYIFIGDDSNTFLNYIPYAVIGTSLIFLILPCKCSCRKSKSKAPGDKDFTTEVMNFKDDYLRANPLTRKEGESLYLNLIEQKNGKIAREIFEIELKKNEENMSSDDEEANSDTLKALNRYARRVINQSAIKLLTTPSAGLAYNKQDPLVTKSFNEKLEPEYLLLPSINDESYAAKYASN